MDSSLIYLDAGDGGAVEEITGELINKNVDCILCMDDSICSSVVNKLAKEGVSIPKDIKVASFYNSSMLENNQPAITSLQFDVSQLGTVSCNTLLACIDKKEVPAKTLLDYEVIIKESTKL